MAYIDYSYYSETFHGSRIRPSDFERLAEVASDIIDTVCTRAITESTDMELVKKAVAYQVEHLHGQGGMDAITGSATVSQITSESLDDYSISTGQNESAKSEMYSLNGIPVSALAIAMLKRAGLIGSRWVYAGRRCPRAY